MKERPSWTLSEAQKSSLGALIDTLVPPLPVPGTDDADGSEENKEHATVSNHKNKSDPALRRYWEYQLSQDPAYLAAVESAIRKLPDAWLVQLLLSMLSTTLGTCLLTGRLATRAFPELSRSKQTSLLESMQQGGGGGQLVPFAFVNPLQQQIFQGFKRLLCGLAYSYTNAGKNPYWEAMGYPGSPNYKEEKYHHVSSSDHHPHYAAFTSLDTSRTVAAMSQLTFLNNAFLLTNLIPHSTGTGSSTAASASSSDIVTYIDCDVLIVGSGAGACVAASVLARAGYQVLVVEKGHYYSPAELTNLEADALDRMYESHGMLTSKSKAMVLLAGSTLGGGTSINWSCCLALPEFVRQEWVQQYGLDSFQDGGEYEKALKYVLVQIGALDSSNTRNKQKMYHSAMNQRLQRGCNVMGYAWESTMQNLKDPSDPSAGYICFGDRYGNKNGGVSVFLKDAVKHGAKIVTSCRVTRILTELPPSSTDDSGSGTSSSGGSADEDKTKLKIPTRKSRGRPRATGALCRIGGTDGGGAGGLVQISARKAVVVAAGALHTPCLLQKSGLANPHIGRHLHLHPVTNLCGLMKDDDIIDPYLGAPMTTVCNEFALGPMGNGYGARIECPSAHPGLMAAGLAWNNPQQYKERMQKVRHSVPLVVLQRDASEGRVRLARDGKTVIVDYTINDADRLSMSQTLRGGLQILITAGAQMVTTSHIKDPGLVLESQGSYSLLRMASDEQVQNYLSFVSAQEIKNFQVGLYSAHQMGTCRMSTSPLMGAVDVNGETWDCDNLYVMDTSTFPTASGVNPMVTVLAIAKMLSTRLAMRLRYQDQRPMGSVESARAQELITKRSELRSRQYPYRSPYSQMLLSHLPSVQQLKLPPRKRQVQILVVTAAVLILISVLGALLRRQSYSSSASVPIAPPPSPPGATPDSKSSSWVEDLFDGLFKDKLPGGATTGLLGTSLIWSILLFPFF